MDNRRWFHAARPTWRSVHFLFFFSRQTRNFIIIISQWNNDPLLLQKPARGLQGYIYIYIYIQEMTDKATIFLSLCKGAKRGAAYSSRTAPSSSDARVYFLITERSKSAPSYLLCLCFFPAERQAPSSPCLALRQNMKCALAHSPHSLGLRACRV